MLYPHASYEREISIPHEALPRAELKKKIINEKPKRPAWIT